MCTPIWTGLNSERSPGSFMWLGNVSCPFLWGGSPLQWIVSLLFEESVLSVEISPTVRWSILCIRFTYSAEGPLLCWGLPRSVKGSRALWKVTVLCEGSSVLWRVFLLCCGFLHWAGPIPLLLCFMVAPMSLYYGQSLAGSVHTKAVSTHRTKTMPI